MDLTGLAGYDLRGLNRKNVLLGKNGCGKSYLLKRCEQALRTKDEIGAVRYLSPERGGNLVYEPGIEQNLRADTWLAESRRKNQTSNFRQQSATQFRRLELLVLREIEQTPALRDDHEYNFGKTVDRINTLLDRVSISRVDPSFKIHDKTSGAEVTAESISSGEAELISLGIECLAFERECKPDKTNVLLFDEPDVHLHPDLQARFVRFLEQLNAPGQMVVVLATHSTAILGGMSTYEDARLAFMKYGETQIAFTPVSDAHKKVLPVFGAHPLSNIFNQAPILLVEGEDDERIWQQAVRSSEGRIKVYPCSVDGLPELRSFEQEVDRILNAVYDNAVGYSLRDRDLGPEDISDVGQVKRMRLKCRAAENLVLCDEVLVGLGLEWADVKSRVDTWVANNQEHPHYHSMNTFAHDGYDRKGADLKVIRNDLVGLLGTNKPWEVVVGQALAGVSTASVEPPEMSIVAFLGPDVCSQLLGLPA